MALFSVCKYNDLELLVLYPLVEVTGGAVVQLEELLEARV